MSHANNVGFGLKRLLLETNVIEKKLTAIERCFPCCVSVDLAARVLTVVVQCVLSAVYMASPTSINSVYDDNTQSIMKKVVVEPSLVDLAYAGRTRSRSSTTYLTCRYDTLCRTGAVRCILYRPNAGKRARLCRLCGSHPAGSSAASYCRSCRWGMIHLPCLSDVVYEDLSGNR